MGDEQNALSLCCKILHDLHKLLDFLGSENCSRLVKNQDLIVTVKHFQDLCSLLHANCSILNDGIRIYCQTISLRKLHNLFAGTLFLKETIFCSLDSKNNVIQNTEAFYQLEVLMYHSDTQVVSVIWIFDLYLFAILMDFALFRLIQTKQNTHQCRFTCSVLSQKCMNLTFF